ncbi:AMP-binding protein [Myxococcota bacterium]|nr:AMP-binding protein [Myxococcota bacterium]
MAEARTAPARFLACVDRDPDRVALVFPADPRPAGLDLPPAEEVAPGWRALRLRQAEDHVGGLALRLRSLGVAQGAAVAVQAEADPAWALLDLAIQAAGGVPVELPRGMPAVEVGRRLYDRRATLLVVPDASALDRLEGHLDDLPDLRHALALAGGPGTPTLVPARPDPTLLRRMVAALDPQPPGPRAGFRPGGGPVAFHSPPAHLRTELLVQALEAGVPSWSVPTGDELPCALRTCRPQALVTSPGGLERLQAQVEARAAAGGPIPAARLRWAVGVGAACRRGEAAGTRLPRRLRLQRRLARGLVGAWVRAELGGALDRVVGGPGLSTEVAAWFQALDIAVWPAPDPRA